MGDNCLTILCCFLPYINMNQQSAIGIAGKSWAHRKDREFMWERLFELWCWRRFLGVPWTSRRSNQSILKEIHPEYALEGLMLKLKLQYFGHLIMKNWLIRKDPDAARDWGQEEKGMTEDKMVGWHRWLDGHEFEQALGVGNGQGSLTFCCLWDCNESDTTEWLNCTELNLFSY